MGNSVLIAVTLFPLYAASVVTQPESRLANRERDLTTAWTCHSKVWGIFPGVVCFCRACYCPPYSTV